MMLRYVGEDGKDGLRHGKVYYDCFLATVNGYPTVCNNRTGQTMMISYKTLKEMLENWQEV